MAPDQEDGFDSDAVRSLLKLHALLICVLKTLCLQDLQGIGEVSCPETSMLYNKF